ncbi:MerR family transcriptional regulator [Bradyrhizobium lablabi]|uniref:MerR family transcriptional regulator n=1 Tax=Bradyrhizobium lablabi TaxID=722472 RepID=UPI001BAE3064|nr:MerR family transcriptional regulator [Bradyrhizobium lablabi]MBR1123973.1 MerR family transcriptional regulator [Bradyrhizobium lablabi]
MTQRTYSIGEASRLSGVSVRRLRFYADEGLLPPAGRTESGYRVFTDSELVRLNLICCLRDAGLDLGTIREVLSHDLSLAEALKLRLEALEAEIAAQRRVASALRAALRSSDPTEADLRRYWTMTRLSQAERRSVVERFYQEVSDGVRIDPKWIHQMIDSSIPELPDEPTPEQCDAWIELSEILNDPNFIAQMRSNASEFWNRDGFDPAAYRQASDEMRLKAKEAIDRGLEPASEEGAALVQDWMETLARTLGRQPDATFKVWLLGKYTEHDDRASRYWELVAIMKGQSPQASPNREWKWVLAAMKHHLAG